MNLMSPDRALKTGMLLGLLMRMDLKVESKMEAGNYLPELRIRVIGGENEIWVTVRVLEG